MIKVYVLVVTEAHKTTQVTEMIRQVPGVTEVEEVIGPYDIVATFEVDTFNEATKILVEGIRKIGHIESTVSLVSVSS